jgi:hypothetical protein
LGRDGVLEVDPATGLIAAEGGEGQRLWDSIKAEQAARIDPGNGEATAAHADRVAGGGPVLPGARIDHEANPPGARLDGGHRADTLN